MNQDEMKARTKDFAQEVIRLTQSLPTNRTGDVLGKQLLRSGTSIGANYRAACRAKSTADFISKLGTVEEAAEASAYWMELLVHAELGKQHQLSPLMQEADELADIAAASIATARAQL